MDKISAAQQQFLNNAIRHRKYIRLGRWAILILFLALWEGSVRLGWLNDFIFSSPSRLLVSFWAIALTLKAKYSRGPKIQKQLLFYPVANPYFDNESYQRFGKDFYLTRDGMKWFWNQYAPSHRERNGILVSPLRADSSQLRGLPEALVITGEADVLRDEGEAYAAPLRSAGVPVTAARFQGILHDFVMLHALDATNACRGAMDLAVEWIYRKNTEAAGRKTG